MCQCVRIVYEYLFESLLSVLLDVWLGVELLGHMILLCFTLWETANFFQCHLVFKLLSEIARLIQKDIILIGVYCIPINTFSFNVYQLIAILFHLLYPYLFHPILYYFKANLRCHIILSLYFWYVYLKCKYFYFLIWVL